MTVDALYDTDSGYDIPGFYRKFGFQYADPEESLPPKEGFRTMYFDLLPPGAKGDLEVCGWDSQDAKIGNIPFEGKNVAPESGGRCLTSKIAR